MPRKPVKAAAPAKVEPVTIKNHRKGTELHLGDGRKLAFGDSAEVSAEVRAAILAIGSGE
jgi:hypothetical protein